MIKPHSLIASSLASALIAGLPAFAQELPREPELASAEQLIVAFGCVSCHQIPGVSAAQGLVGPPLDHFAQHSYIAGTLPNNRENLVNWLMNPRQVHPGSAMPDTGLNRTQASVIADFLYRQD